MELISLASLAIIYLFAFIPGSIGKAQYYGLSWTIGNRELPQEKKEIDQLNSWFARAERAYKNLQTNFPPFAVAILLLILFNKTSQFTGILALSYLALRIFHFLSYALGWAMALAISFSISWAINIALLLLVLR